MDPDRTIRTTAAGRRAAAARDGRLERGQEPTRPIMLSSEDRRGEGGEAASLRRILAAIADMLAIPYAGEMLAAEVRGSAGALAELAVEERNAGRLPSLAEQAERTAAAHKAKAGVRS